MGSRQLAIVLAPNILRSVGGADPVALMSKIASANTVVAHLMDHYFTKSSNIRSSVGKWRPVSQLFAQKSQKSQLLFEIQNFRPDNATTSPKQSPSQHRLNPLFKVTSEKRFTSQHQFQQGFSEHRGNSPDAQRSKDDKKTHEPFGTTPKSSSVGVPFKFDAPILGSVRGNGKLPAKKSSTLSPPQVSLSLDSASPITISNQIDIYDLSESSNNDRWNNINEINEKNTSGKRTQKISGISTYRTQSTMWKKCSPSSDGPT